jgi:hypothetical protein
MYFIRFTSQPKVLDVFHFPISRKGREKLNKKKKGKNADGYSSRNIVWGTGLGILD